MGMAKKESTPIPDVPKLPETTVGATKAPGGTPPVAPAARRPNENGKDGLDSERMSKADWANKDKAIELTAIEKSSIESPLLAHMVMGKNQEEAFALVRAFTKHNLETHELAKAGKL